MPRISLPVVGATALAGTGIAVFVALSAPATAGARPATPTPAVATPQLSASPVAPSSSSAGQRTAVPPTPSLRATVVPSTTPGTIEVPAGKADVSTSGSGDADGVLLVALAGGGALLLAGGVVVAVSRRRA